MSESKLYQPYWKRSRGSSTCYQSTSSPLDADLAIQCALLHDIIEDTPFTNDDVQNGFGQSVADGVLALTKDECMTSKNEMMKDSLNCIK